MSDTFDRIERIGHSQLQHGPSNQRVYVMKADRDDMPGLLDRVDQLVGKHGYTKVFAKIPEELGAAFTARGYVTEAQVPGFYGGTGRALFMGLYVDSGRACEQKAELVGKVLAAAHEKAGGVLNPEPAPEGCSLRELKADDADAMAEVYREVFASYPFPIHDAAYLAETMRTHIRYFGVFEGGRLIALSSAEMDRAGRNVEMTDFATLPAARGKGLALHLLRAMELAMAEEDICTAFTIARAYSYGMNITFAKAGYSFGGTLTNNTQISGCIESMNVWYRGL